MAMIPYIGLAYFEQVHPLHYISILPLANSAW
jgi:hypothetical protein